ncbi:MAG: sel1 repeat family protein [Nitrospinae bacterium]|nr:sel1 repeat family protein [Nitrospinota bacterium]
MPRDSKGATFLSAALALLVLFALAPGLPAGADTSAPEKWKAAIDALKRNDYETAYRELKPLAEDGNAAAQYQLGLLYEGGKGVRKDLKEAAKWIREAAEQGIADAQIVLSNKYQNGEGVRKDLTEAYIWASLAANTGVRRAIELKNKLAKKLDPKQLAEAERSLGDRR